MSMVLCLICCPLLLICLQSAVLGGLNRFYAAPDEELARFSLWQGSRRPGCPKGYTAKTEAGLLEVMENAMSRTKIIKGACTTFALTALLSAPTFADQSTQQSSTSDTDATIDSMERKASDAWREGKLDTIYLFNRQLNNFTIDPEVVGSTVVLTGKVESEVDKALAEQLALGIDGITEVENRLTVAASDEARSGKSDSDRALSDKIEDATLTAEVKTQLLANDETHGLSINVDTVSRNVTLSGTVASAAEKDLAGELAEQVEGVSSVNNSLVISES